MTAFKKGQKYYRDGGKVTRKHGTFSVEFMSGYNFEERISRCGYDLMYWNKTRDYKSL